MSNHTPAPWFVVNDGESYDILGNEIEVEHGEFGTILGQSSYVVACSIDRQYDARLIAAAPDLLAIAKRLHRWITRFYSDFEEGGHFVEGELGYQVLEELNTAIAKARGGTQ